MSPFVRPLLGLAFVVVVGTVVDLALHVVPSRTALRWPLRVIVGLAALYLALTLPTFGVALAVFGVVVRVRCDDARGVATSPRRSAAERRALVVVGVLGALVMVRPPVPLYWDEFVWLAKARIEAAHPFGLVTEVLRANSSAIPLGYPPLEPLAVAALSGWAPDTTSLMLGAGLLEVACASAFILVAIERTPRSDRRSLALAVALACAPLVALHLRSAYVDLETGLLAGTLLLLLELGCVRAAVAVAVVLVGLKDEGTVHVAAVTLATFALALGRRKWRAAQSSAAVAVLAFIPFFSWHAKLWRAGVSRTDHALSGLAFARLPELARLTFRHAVELLAWGPLWAIVIGMFLALVVRPRTFGRAARLRLFVLAAQVLVFTFGLLATSDRVMEFARAGSLIGRLLVELAPMAMLAITAAA